MKEEAIIDKVKKIVSEYEKNNNRQISSSSVNKFEFENIFLSKDSNLENLNICHESNIFVLGGDLNNVTIIVTEDNTILDGNGFTIKNTNGMPAIIIVENIKNVTIKNIKLEENLIGILSQGENVKVDDVVFKKNILGILANGGRNTNISKNIFIENFVGVVFLSYVSSSNINNNIFINNTVSILMNESCSYNQIISNKITVNLLKLQEYGIILGENNSFNEISKNIIDFSNRKSRGTIFTNNYVSIGISIVGLNSIMNKISENNINCDCNCIAIDGYLYGVIRINNIYIDKSSANEVCKNKLSINKNEFIISGEDLNINLCNIVINEEVRDGKIFNNNIVVCKNIINPNGIRREINIENILIHLNNSNLLIKNNTLSLYSNLSCHKNRENTIIKDFRNNIRILESNSANTIILNDFYLEKNGPCIGNGIFLFLKNTSNEITENNFKKISHFAINFEVENNSNFISRNKIRDTKGSAIIFRGRVLVGNDFNIITGNDIGRSRGNGVLFFMNNKQNSISNNHINCNTLIGVYFKEEGNIFNYIFKNSFKGNGENIWVGKDKPNYIDNNILK